MAYKTTPYASRKGRQKPSDDPVVTGKVKLKNKSDAIEFQIAQLAESNPAAFVAGSPTSLYRAPANTMYEYRALMRSRTEIALGALEKVIIDAQTSEDIALRGLAVKAANIILDHGWGKPVQAVAVAEVKDDNKEVIALSKEKLEAIARAVIPEEIENGESSGD